jgi:hypothetical protein
MTEEIEARIREAAAQAGLERLRPIKEIVGDDVSYESIHIVVATMRNEKAGASGAG